MKQTCPTPRRQESTKSSSGFACARSAHAGIVPLIDRPGGEPPPEVLIGVPPLVARTAPGRGRRSAAIQWPRRGRVKARTAALSAADSSMLRIRKPAFLACCGECFRAVIAASREVPEMTCCRRQQCFRRRPLSAPASMRSTTCSAASTGATTSSGSSTGRPSSRSTARSRARARCSRRRPSSRSAAPSTRTASRASRSSTRPSPHPATCCARSTGCAIRAATGWCCSSRSTAWCARGA